MTVLSQPFVSIHYLLQVFHLSLFCLFLGCVPLLVQLVHAREESAVVRQRASQALHNLVHCHTDDKRGRREARVLRLLQQLIDFSDNVQHSSSDQGI